MNKTKNKITQDCRQIGRWYSHPASAPCLSARGKAPQTHVLCISENVLEIPSWLPSTSQQGAGSKKGSCDLHIRLSLNNLLVSDAVRLHAEFLFVLVTTF